MTAPQLLGETRYSRNGCSLGSRYIRNTTDKRTRSARGKGGGLCSRLGLIQVQRQCRRLYDDEEHLGDRRACNFLVARRHRTCTPLCMRSVSDTRVSVHVLEETATCARSDAPPVTVARDQFVSGRGLAVMRLR